jgi:hypothetical protein
MPGGSLRFFAHTPPTARCENSGVPCLLVIVLLLFPRVVLVLMFIFTNYLERAYHGLLVPLLGFLFLPLTTIVYAWLVNSRLPLEGINLLYLILAVVIDAGGLGGGEFHRRQRYV